MTIGEKVPVLDSIGFVCLEEMMGGDDVVVEAARICYQSKSSGPDADKLLIYRLMCAKPHHNTVFEHAVFRFRVKCPLFVARQWMRHRICTFNEKSLRYCTAAREYYVPPGEDRYGREDYIRKMEEQFGLYEDLIAHGWRKEQARGVLGTAVYTEFIWTVNFWSLTNWFEKRTDKAAQWETRQYAEAILKLVSEVMPVTVAAMKKHILGRDS